MKSRVWATSLVLLELLRRQEERSADADSVGTTIDAVFIINGGLFADAHSHPWQTTPMLKTSLGRAGAWLAQRSPRVFDLTMRSAAMFDPAYPVSGAEIADLRDAITRRDGGAFLHRGAGFVDEHKRNAARWDLEPIFHALHDSVAFHVAGSDNDPFEPRQISAARQRLGTAGLDIRSFPGGHLTTSEHPDLLAATIRELADLHQVGRPAAHVAAPILTSI